MPTQTFRGGTVQDVEVALVEQYGRTNVKQQSKTDSRTEWSFKITSRAHGTCTATRTPDGVTMTMSPRTQTLFLVGAIIGYLACVVPGIVLTVLIIITRAATAGVLSHRFPKMVESVQRAVAAHSGSSPPMPLPLTPPPIV